MTDEIEDALRSNATGPQQASGDAGSVQQHSLSDQIAADRYLASKAATKKAKRGLVIQRITPPGAN
jgi:hypothetical protein